MAAVVGSGMMAERLTGDAALALLCNTLPTGAMLVVLIAIFGPISGAHLNPAVTAAFALKREIAPRDAALYVIAQIAGGIAGTATAHLMFAAPILEASATVRAGSGLWFSEAVAAFGLVSVILAGMRFEPRSLPWLVGLYISFRLLVHRLHLLRQPGCHGRALADGEFSGIRPIDAPAFIAAQFAGALAALALMNWLLPSVEKEP